MEKEKPSNLDMEVILVGREIYNNSPHVYTIAEDYTLNTLPVKELQLRQRYNATLEYYVIAKSSVPTEDLLEYVLNLIKKKIKSDLYTYI